ncbi:hypothetical protein D3C86_1601560 [compost metagenome]
MEFYNVFTQRQANTITGILHGIIYLKIVGKELIKVDRRNPYTGIRYTDYSLIFCGSNLKGDLSPGRREFVGIGKQVKNNLLQLFFIEKNDDRIFGMQK